MHYHIRSGIGAIGSGLGVIGLLTSASLSSFAQTNRGNGEGSIVVVSAPGSLRAAEEIVREIDDPATGDRWLLERDSLHPGGPGRMVLLAQGKTSPPARDFSEGLGRAIEIRTPAAMIHAGDHLLVEEHNRLLDAVLEAIALTPARKDATLRIRLSIGGRVMNAVAIAPGRALLSPEYGAQP